MAHTSHNLVQDILKDNPICLFIVNHIIIVDSYQANGTGTVRSWKRLLCTLHTLHALHDMCNSAGLTIYIYADSHLHINAAYTQLLCCRAFNRELRRPAVFQRIPVSNVLFKDVNPPTLTPLAMPRGSTTLSLWLAHTHGHPAQLTAT